MKNYSYFFLGILLPGIINFFAIPIFKRALGESVYAEYNLLLTALLMSNMILVGWISHSVIRLASQAADKTKFIQESVWISIIVSAFAAIAGIIVLIIWQGKILLSILCGLMIITMAVQLILNGAAQAHLKAKIIMYSESLRVGLGFLLGYALIMVTGLHFSVEKLFLGLAISNFLACVVLFKGIGLSLRQLTTIRMADVKNTAGKLFHYGIYLMLWFLCAYALMYNDRYIIFYQLGKEMAGHYTAMFDIINRSISIAALPLLMATFPILSQKYDEGSFIHVEKLLGKLLLIEIIALPVSLVAYWLFGYKLLSSLLKLPADNSSFFWAGLLVLAGSICGQIGMVVHKRMELKKETSKMFRIMLIVFSMSLLFNLLFIRSTGIIGAGCTFLFGNILYAVIVYFKSERNKHNKLEQKIATVVE